MDFNSWLKHLETLSSGLTNKSLKNVSEIAKKLDVLKFNGKVITVAGTNGKGSTVILLESIILALGFKTGAFISPHLLNYNERIRLNGKEVDEETLCRVFEVVEKERGTTALSYFEFTTLTALVIFKQQPLDYLILEVGLGGRYDAVNIVDSDISVITTISFDHMCVLGNTKEAIGYEKSGIMRKGHPVVCGRNMPETVVSEAIELKTTPYFLGQDFFDEIKGNSWEWKYGDLKIENLPLIGLPLGCASIAIMLVKLLFEDFETKIPAIKSGIKKAFLIGRFQKMKFEGKEIILDIAHNFEATTTLASCLKVRPISGRNLVVASMLKDKDIAGAFTPLVRIADHWYLGALATERGATSEQLARSLEQVGGKDFLLLPTVEAAFREAIAECQEIDRIVVFGSFQTVAVCLKIILSQKLETNSEPRK